MQRAGIHLKVTEDFKPASTDVQKGDRVNRK